MVRFFVVVDFFVEVDDEPALRVVPLPLDFAAVDRFAAVFVPPVVFVPLFAPELLVAELLAVELLAAVLFVPPLAVELFAPVDPLEPEDDFDDVERRRFGESSPIGRALPTAFTAPPAAPPTVPTIFPAVRPTDLTILPGSGIR